MNTLVPPPPARRFFFDTEFIAVGSTVHPISVGVVTLQGQTFYAEIDAPWREYSDAWTKTHVEPHLGKGPLYTPEESRAYLLEFVGNAPCEFWAYFATYDWVVLCQLMGGLLSLPKELVTFRVGSGVAKSLARAHPCTAGEESPSAPCTLNHLLLARLNHQWGPALRARERRPGAGFTLNTGVAQLPVPGCTSSGSCFS